MITVVWADKEGAEAIMELCAVPASFVQFQLAESIYRSKAFRFGGGKVKNKHQAICL